MLRDAIVNLRPLSKVEIQKLTEILARPYTAANEQYGESVPVIVLNLLRMLQLSIRDSWQDRMIELNEAVLTLQKKIVEKKTEISDWIYAGWDLQDTSITPITWNDLVLAKPETWLPVFTENLQRQDALWKRYYVADYAKMIMRLFSELEKEFAFASMSESLKKQYQEILGVALALTTYHWHEKYLFEIWLYATLANYDFVLEGMNVRTSLRYLLKHTLSSWRAYVALPEYVVLTLSAQTEATVLAISGQVINCIAQHVCVGVIGELLADWALVPDDKTSRFKLQPLAKFLEAYGLCEEQSQSVQKNEKFRVTFQEELRAFSEIAEIPEKLILQVLQRANHFRQQDCVKEYYQLLFISYLRRIGDLPILQLRKRISFLVNMGPDIRQFIIVFARFG